MRLSITLLPGLVFGLVLAGCDRQKAEAPQGEAATPAVAESAGKAVPASYPTGRLDRSHAGTEAPDIAFEDPSGEPARMADFRGRPVLVNLWATWCVPCREEMPALNNLQKALGGDDFEVVAINIDTGSDEKPKAFLDETGVNDLAYYRDSSMGVFNALKKEGLAFGLPVTLLMDDKGCLISSMNGPAAWDSEDAMALISAAKGGPES